MPAYHRSRGRRPVQAELSPDCLLKAGVETLVGALHQATAENQLLRRQMADRTAVLRSLPLQRQPEAPP
jgi:hypothetical protein